MTSTSTPSDRRVAGSFRDPSGFVFERGGVLFRQVNRSYRAAYDRLTGSGLDRALIDDGWLIPHVEEDGPLADPEAGAVLLRPERVPFVSYPYEWCFGQLKDAALRTLDIQRRALDSGMTLKDASAFNIQFVAGRPVLIDSLSFEPYEEGRPWVAYRQFCQHFLAPLAVMSRVDPRALLSFRVHLDGLPLDLASKLLPRRTWLQPGLLIHVHAHARSQRAHGDAAGALDRSRPFPRRALLGMLDSLRSAVAGLTWNPGGTEWADYYDATNYTDAATDRKLRMVEALVDRVRPRTAWDLGANTGRFSRVAAEAGAEVVAFDVDPACVERNYREVVARGERRVLPLLTDLANPSPALGWDHTERSSLLDRGPADLVLALALVHHLAISNNLPLGRVASFLRRAGRSLIVEFVPKSDSQVRRLLAGRDDVFPDYTQDGFELAFAPHFAVEHAERIADSDRTLYLMRARPE